MPTAELTDCLCYYELTGGPAPGRFGPRPGGGEAVILVAGLGCTCRSWDPITPDLAARRWVLAADNRGLGQSHATRPPRRVNDYAADLIELMDHLQIGRADVVGLSLGGVIAQRLAADHPARVGRLVLISTAARFSPYLRHTAHLLGTALRRFSRRQFLRTLELLSASPISVDADPGRLSRHVHDDVHRGISKRAIGAQLRCLAASEPPGPDRPVRAPTLVIGGGYDSVIPACYGRQLADELHDARFVLLPDAGHNPLDECPGRVLDLIEGFLDRPESANNPADPVGAATN